MKASEQPAIAPTTPFSAVVVLAQFWPDGSGRVFSRTAWDYYRLKDGSEATRNKRQIEPEERPGTGKITDLALSHDLFVEPITKSVITIKRSPGAQLNEMEGEWEENCPGEDENVESTEPGEEFFGYPTIHVVKQFDSTWREDRWMIRDLRCFSVKEIDVAGASKDETLVTSLSVGEPPRSVLSAPEGYVERSPAQAMKAYALARNGEQLFSAGALKKLTAEYSNPPAK